MALNTPIVQQWQARMTVRHFDNTNPFSSISETTIPELGRSYFAGAAGRKPARRTPLKPTPWTKLFELGGGGAATAKFEHERALRESRERRDVSALEAEADKAQDRSREVERAICQSPAEGMIGLGIKLTVWRHFEYLNDDADLGALNVAAALDDIAQITGLDFAAEARKATNGAGAAA